MVKPPVELAGELWIGALSQSICRTPSGVTNYLCHTGWELPKQFCVAVYQTKDRVKSSALFFLLLRIFGCPSGTSK